MPQKSEPAPKQQVQAFFDNLERELDQIEYFRPLDKRATMVVNLRNIFARMQPTRQDIQTLHGIAMALVEGRKGPARGGVLDGEEAKALRALLAEYGDGRVPGERSPVRGLARLLRRNPTEAERMLWEALTRDRRFAGQGFKRQVPVGPHIADFVSFPLRVVIDVVQAGEHEAAQRLARQKRAWLADRGYRVLGVSGAELEADVGAVLDRLAQRTQRRALQHLEENRWPGQPACGIPGSLEALSRRLQLLRWRPGSPCATAGIYRPSIARSVDQISMPSFDGVDFRPPSGRTRRSSKDDDAVPRDHRPAQRGIAIDVGGTMAAVDV